MIALQVTVIGPFLLELVQIRLGRIVFQYSHKPTAASHQNQVAATSKGASHSLLGHGAGDSYTQPLISFEYNLNAVDVDLEEVPHSKQSVSPQPRSHPSTDRAPLNKLDWGKLEKRSSPSIPGISS